MNNSQNKEQTKHGYHFETDYKLHTLSFYTNLRTIMSFSTLLVTFLTYNKQQTSVLLQLTCAALFMEGIIIKSRIKKPLKFSKQITQRNFIHLINNMCWLTNCHVSPLY